MAPLALMFLRTAYESDCPIINNRISCLDLLLFFFFKTGMLPNPAWNQTDMMNVHFVTSLYGFHIIFNILVMLLVYSIMAFHGKLMGCAKRMLGYSDCVSTYEYHK